MNATSRPIARAGLIAILLGLAVACVPSVHAQELIQPATKVRKFPRTFCPMPVDLEFIANGPSATIRFSTNVFYEDPFNNNTLTWSEQYLDNICVALKSVYDANLGLPGSFSRDCYAGDPIPQRFYFQNAGTLPWKELFDTDPAPRGWDLGHGASWAQTNTAPNNPGVENSFSPTGSLHLGQQSATSSLSDSAYTSFTVNGLTPGATYVLTGWWDARNFENNTIYLTTRIFGSGATPVARRTWGGLKRQYK